MRGSLPHRDRTATRSRARLTSAEHQGIFLQDRANTHRSGIGGFLHGYQAARQARSGNLLHPVECLRQPGRRDGVHRPALVPLLLHLRGRLQRRPDGRRRQPHRRGHQGRLGPRGRPGPQHQVDHRGLSPRPDAAGRRLHVQRPVPRRHPSAGPHLHTADLLGGRGDRLHLLQGPLARRWRLDPRLHGLPRHRDIPGGPGRPSDQGDRRGACPRTT